MKNHFARKNLSVASAGLVLSALGLGCWAVELPPAPIVVNLDSDAGAALVAGVGFNDALANGSYRHDEPDYLDAAGALQPETLRFPGGTVSNFYQPGSDAFAYHPTLNSDINARMQANFNELAVRQGGQLPYARFLDAVAAQGVGKPLVVVNPYTTSAQTSAAWVDDARVRGDQVYGWELGNELYMHAYADIFATPGDFVLEAQAHADAMRTADAVAQIGVPSAPYRAPFPQTASDIAWNTAMAGGTFYDAVVTHIYVGVPPPTLSLEDASDYMLGAAASGGFIDQRLDSLQADYGSSVPIWVTEWNWYGWNNVDLNHTTLNLMFVADAWARIAMRPQVEVQAYHHFASDHAWPSVLMRDYGAPGLVKPSYRTPAFFVFALLRDASVGMDWQAEPLALGGQIIERDILYEQQSVSVRYPEVFLWWGWRDDESGFRVLAVNHGAVEQSVELEFAGAAAAGLSALLVTGNPELRCLSGAALDSDEHLTADLGLQDETAHILSEPIVDGVLTLPAYSVCVALVGA